MKLLNIVKTRIYEFNKWFNIEVQVTGNTCSAYLQRKGYGVKMSLFKIDNIDLDDFVELVKHNMEVENYIADYNELYVCEEDW